MPRCTDTPSPPPLFASLEPCAGTTEVSSFDPLPPLLHLGMEALTASLPLALAMVLGGPPALISTDANAGSVVGAAGGGIERDADLAFVRVDRWLSDLRPTLSSVLRGVDIE